MYQHLCTAALANSEEYEILAEEIQLNDSDGKTIGAIDLILKNRTLDQLEHWEVAIKFYLLHEGVWYGPNAHDQLHTKLDRMLSHQLKMSERPEFRQMLPLDQSPKERLLMQGRLYINPFSNEVPPKECLGFALNPSQISGYWCYQSQWSLINKPLYHLSKPNWAIGTDDFSQPIENQWSDLSMHKQQMASSGSSCQIIGHKIQTLINRELTTSCKKATIWSPFCQSRFNYKPAATNT